MFCVLEDDKEPTLRIEQNSNESRIFNPVLKKAGRDKYVPSDNITELALKNDQLYFIDTNFMHSGVAGRPESKRIAFVCEISNKLKNFARGSVGVRQEP